jgi:hypothetical protein
MDITIYKDAQIASFSLSHDSIASLAKAKFTIDQINGLIFNNDSLPYGTEFDKVICKVTYVSSVRGTMVMQEATGDSIYWNGTDSLDFSKPVRFITTAQDGATTKSYLIRINIHQVVPDSMVWERYVSPVTGLSAVEQRVVAWRYNDGDACFMYSKTTGGSRLHYAPSANLKEWTELALKGFPATADIPQITTFEDALYVSASDGLYRSADGLAWEKALNAPTVKVLLGAIRAAHDKPALLSAIVETGGSLTFAAMDRKGEWLPQGETVPGEFPLSGFGSINYSRMSYEYLMLVAGKDRNGQLLNTTWATDNALRWTLFTREGTGFFEKKEGVMVAKYDDKFYLTGGIIAQGEASSEIHLSQDNGISWTKADSLITFPEAYAGRGYASIQVVDATNYMLLFGGKTSKDANHLDEIWRGRINRLAK